jgi:hypothetical protein
MKKKPLFLALLLASCAPPPSVAPEAPTYIDTSEPKVGETVTAQVGDPVVTMSHGISRAAIQFLADCSFSEKRDMPGTGTVNFLVRGGVVFPRMNTTNGVPGYCGVTEQNTPLIGNVAVNHCVAVSDQSLVPFPNSQMIVQSNCRVDRQTLERDAPDSVKKELLYDGRSGTTLRLSYREFVRDMARPAFTQELTYDLRDDRVVGFRGARLEVIDANNTSIRYRVLSGF